MPTSLSRRRGIHNVARGLWRWVSCARLSLSGICFVAYLVLSVSDDNGLGATSLDIAIHAMSESQTRHVPEIVGTIASAQEVQSSSEVGGTPDPANVVLNSSLLVDVHALSESPGSQDPRRRT